MSLFHSGSCEPLKAATHGALGLLALVALGYNAIAFTLRREKHLAVNVVLYGALVGIEARKISHHRKGR